MLASKGLEAEFPLFTAVHKVNINVTSMFLLFHILGLLGRTAARAVDRSN